MTLIEKVERAAENATPGPWVARFWDGDKWPERRWSVGEEDTGAAICVSPRYADPTDLSDADLIALAPDMANALLAAEELISWVEGALEEGRFRPTDEDDVAAALAAYRAAMEASQ